MLQFFILYLAFLFIGSCESESRFITGPQGGYIESQKSQAKKTPILPPDYFKCGDSFYWNAMKFMKNVSMYSSTEPNYVDQIDIVTEFPDQIMGSGLQMSPSSLSFSENDRHLCYDIYNMLSDIMAENRIYQYFEYKTVKDIISSSDEFKEIDEKSAIISKIFHKFDANTRTKKFTYRLELPVSVSCEKKWSVKRDPTSTTKAIFKEPEGRCNFSSEGHELKLTSGEKVLVALRGYYEADPKYPDKRTLVMIETYGFKYLP